MYLRIAFCGDFAVRCFMGFTRERWTSVWRSVTTGEGTDHAFNLLQSLYAEPHRHYHTACHIAACLQLFDGVRKRVNDPPALELALWFHDAIYDPRATDNEERSAHLAAETIGRAGGAESLARRVHALVLATRSHRPDTEPDARWIVDIDLAIFGQSAEAFDTYETAIRAEYAWVDAVEYAAKRAGFLSRFLARPAIYVTDEFRERFEAPARANLARSIRQLKGAARDV